MDSSRISSQESAHSAKPANQASRTKTAGEGFTTPSAFSFMLSGLEDAADQPAPSSGLAALRTVGRNATDVTNSKDAAGAPDASVLSAMPGVGANAGAAIVQEGQDQDEKRAGNALGDTLQTHGQFWSRTTDSGAAAAGRAAAATRGTLSGNASVGGSDAAGLLASSLWAGHSGALGGQVSQTVRMDTAGDQGTGAAVARGPAQRTVAERRSASGAGGLASMAAQQQQPKQPFVLAARGGDGLAVPAVQLSASLAALGVFAKENGVGRATVEGPVFGDGLPTGGGAINQTVLASVPGLAETLSRSGTQSRGSGDEQRNTSGGGGAMDTKSPFEMGAEISQTSSGAGTDGASAQDALSEQVTYWLAENLKNAELTVDHEGQPVKVQVSLDGKEAHVAFRSDQPQTRELLDAHIHELRDLLQKEGLVLSGVSVDAQGAGQRDPKDDGRSPPGARQARIAPAADAQAGRTHGALRAAHPGTLDLFV